MYKTSLVVFLVSMIILAAARDPIYSSNGKLTGDDLRLSDPRIKSCMASCPTVRSLLVVCGDDGKSYSNKGRVQCAEKCLKPHGESVKVAFEGFCPDDVPQEERQ